MLSACAPGGAPDPLLSEPVSEPVPPSGPAPASATPSRDTPAPAQPAESSTAPTTSPAQRQFTLVATGDVLLHERLWDQAARDAGPGGGQNFAPQLSAVQPVVGGADVAVCHLETPLAQSIESARGYPTFAAPPEIVPALVATGFDACTTASNHTFDQGPVGIGRTLDRLDEAGLAHAGSARRREEDRPTLVEVATPGGTVTVGLVSYTFGFNGIPYPRGERWRSNEIDESAILRDAAAARRAGAEFVVVALHWGTEFSQEPNDQQLGLAPELLGSPDVDLLLGHHAHVVQPVEAIDGEWVAYGLGNLMAAHRTPGETLREGLLVRFTVAEDPDSGRFATTSAEFLPLLQTDRPPLRVLDVDAALSDPPDGSPSVSRLQTSSARTTRIVQSRGAAEDGLRLLTP